MENDIGPAGDRDAVRRTLRTLDQDRARLARRALTPWWHHPVLGGILAVVAVGISRPGSLGSSLVALGVIGIVLLAAATRRHAGVSVTEPAGPRSRRVNRVLMLVVVIVLGAALGLRLAEASPWWAVLPALAGFAASWALGHRYDRVLRSELAAPGPQR